MLTSHAVGERKQRAYDLLAAHGRGLTAMSAEQRICWVLVCDTCRTDLEDPDNDYVPHFDTLDAATDYAHRVGWQLDTDGRIVCDRCTATAACTVRGHDFTPWRPCACQARIPDHALFGCGLLRTCHRCDTAPKPATLAALPTTDEPPGR